MFEVKSFRFRLCQIMVASMLGALIFIISALFIPAILVVQADDISPNRPIYPAGLLSEEEMDVAEADALGSVDFRIVDIRSEHGQMVVEVEHFDIYGNFAYYELYTWQGREGNIHNIATNDQGLLLLDDMTLAPIQANMAGLYEQYLPPGREWGRDVIPRLNADAITGVISMIHRQRGVSWDKGQQRLTVYPLDFTDQDLAGTDALISTFLPLRGSSYITDPYGSLIQVEYDGPGGPREMPAIIEWGTTSTFTPSMDGYINNASGSNTWSVSRDAATGTGYNDTDVNTQTYLVATTTTNEWNNIHRAVFLFDTSALPDGDVITDATFKFASTYVDSDFGQSAVLILSNPASDTGLAAADFDAFTFTDQAARLPYASVNTGGSVVNEMALNSTGLGNISKTGKSKFGVVGSADADDTPPTWVSGRDGWVQLKSMESATPAQLVVTHTAPTAAVTGTIGDGATEQEVRDGNGTILITLTGDTWVADGATFDAQRQAIIDGLDAASSPATGWNNKVRDSIGVASVVRTSSTLATITLAASDVAGYAITSTETITVTVPASAITSGGAITATPTIAITAVTESAAITGTIGDGATEQEVRDGNGTILITLSNTTWAVAAGSLFDNQRQNIINGLVAADSQTYGWNNEVKAKLGVSAVVRTSDTLVTITIPAGDVGGYQIVTNEVITTTVPATAIGGSALVATPTTTITGTVESAAVSGTLGGSGGTAAEIEAGGETVIITLTNTTWVTAGATFNAQRQNILDGLVADDSDVNGWNAMAFAVGDVERTSGTIVTITLSAESGYAIPSAETVTTTVPATAIGGVALVAPETFTISPSAFATSGTRVSTAINLSGVTDLAYCAIGWETTLPSNTTVGIETSVNGGSTYSTATNGNCPTGLTLGESLASITDFRVKATLTTTDTAATPLITALGLIIEDTGGSELCYQLLTTPSASLTDNCGTYTGTMSFPIGPSTITSSTAPITSTADPLPNPRALAGQDVAQAVTGSATSAKLFPDASEGGGFTGLPLNDLVNEMSTVGDGLPVRFVWFIFLGIATIGAGMMAVHLTSNLFIAAGAMAAVMGFQMAIGTTGLLPGWILFAFIPLAAAYLLFRRGFPA